MFVYYKCFSFIFGKTNVLLGNVCSCRWVWGDIQETSVQVFATVCGSSLSGGLVQLLLFTIRHQLSLSRSDTYSLLSWHYLYAWLLPQRRHLCSRRRQTDLQVICNFPSILHKTIRLCCTGYPLQSEGVGEYNESQFNMLFWIIWIWNHLGSEHKI